MIPWFKKIIHAAFYDEQAFVGWIRGAVLSGSASLVVFIHDIQENFGNAWATRAKCTAVVLGLLAGMIRAGDKTPQDVIDAARGKQ